MSPTVIIVGSTFMVVGLVTLVLLSLLLSRKDAAVAERLEEIRQRRGPEMPRLAIDASKQEESVWQAFARKAGGTVPVTARERSRYGTMLRHAGIRRHGALPSSSSLTTALPR